MSAKEELVEALAEANWRNPLFSRQKCEAWVGQLLADHAHELAEKQRRLAAPAAMLRSERMQGFAAGARAAADLIDPKKEGQ